ncbi:DUF6233 domain-containing protein [Streptomyces sp. SID13666]|uniref:DUF6233 domain-containing protein n=1 Tax=Streptomyces sp. SID13666 TaxID=2706054 RepID=UPI0034E0909A
MGEESKTDNLPVAVIHLADGATLECVVGRRHRAPDGSWWYQLAARGLALEGDAEADTEPEGWPPLAKDWRAGSHHYADGAHWTVHRGGCWIPGERKLTIDQARALVAEPLGHGCDVCDAEDGLRLPAPVRHGDSN